MSDSRYPMLRAILDRFRKRARRAVLSALFLVGCVNACLAQSEPPLSVPPTGRLPAAGNAIPFEGWLFSPSIRVYSFYSDNFFQSPTAPLSVLGFGTTPSLTAEWTNGIHSTTLSGNIDRQVFPTDNPINTFDRQATITQKYAPLRDVTFSALGNYSHKTISSALQNSIPSPIATGNTVLPDGNILLPDGTIVSPSGQVVGHNNPVSTTNASSLIKPYDQYTGTFSVDKIFNHGILNLSGSIAQTDYLLQSTQDNTSKSFTESAGVWLGPLLYAYTNGSIARTSGSIQSPTPTTSYRIIGGIGTRQFGLFRGSAYFGHQGSESGGKAEGDVYGGKLTYYPTPPWTLSLSADETINIASQGFAATLALNLPTPIPQQIPLGTSTRITSTSLSSTYQISQQWTTSESLSYTRTQYVDSSRLDNFWTADATLSYDMWRNMTITWEYQYSRIISNAPFSSSKKNYAIMGANYKF